MPIGSSKIGVLGAGTVPGGTSTFNASGTFTVPPGVTKVNITGKGGTGNPGNPGNSGNAGNPGTGGAGGSGGWGRKAGAPCPCVIPPLNQNVPGGSGGAAFKRFCAPGNRLGGTFAPACYVANFVNTSVMGGASMYYNNYYGNPTQTNWATTLDNGPGQTGAVGAAGQAGQAGQAGNPGQSSSGICKTFPGGSGGAAGNAGAAGTAGNGGTGGVQGCNGPCFQAFFNPTAPQQNKAGGAGGNGGGAGGPSFTYFSPPTCGFVAGGRGGGGASTNACGTSGVSGINAPWITFAPNERYAIAFGAAGARCSQNPNTFPNMTLPENSFNFPNQSTANRWGPPYSDGFFQRAGGYGGGSTNCGFAFPVLIIREGVGSQTVPSPIPNNQGAYNFYNSGTYSWPANQLAQPFPSNNNIFRSGGGGGSGNPRTTISVNAPPQNDRAAKSGGGGGGGRGNAGGAGGSGGSGGSGQAATPQTFNCVPVTPGGSYPITVASPGGQVVISWNPQ